MTNINRNDIPFICSVLIREKEVRKPMDREKFFKALGENIKHYREEKSIKLVELSEKTQINIKYLKKIESGKAFGMRYSQLIKIALTLKVQPYILFWNCK